MELSSSAPPGHGVMVAHQQGIPESLALRGGMLLGKRSVVSRNGLALDPGEGVQAGPVRLPGRLSAQSTTGF